MAAVWLKGKNAMKPTRKLSRRSFLATVAGTVAAAGAITVVATDAAEAQSGCTDSDTGNYSDQAGNGRHCGGGGGSRSGCTDSDSGRYSDPAGNGRCRRRVNRSGCTDSDSGRYSDPAGNGRCRRRRRSCTDSDTGRYADRPGAGRRC
jgi:hypothetical protein